LNWEILGVVSSQSTPTDENVALSKLAEKLILQQEVIVDKPMAIRPTLPAFGNKIEFSVPLKVTPWSELSVNLRVTYKAIKEIGESNVVAVIILFTFILIISSLSLARERK
jgi:hypothetical protein